MTAPFNRNRSRRAALVGLPLVAIVATGVALLVPTLGGAQTQSPPVNTVEPTISGDPVEGNTLTATHGTWTGNGPFTYDYNWRRCPQDGGDGFGANCDGIINHTGNTYTLVAADVGFTMRVRVKATDVNGESAKHASNATGIVTGAGGGPTNTSLPTITGTAQVGQTLTGDKGTWDGSIVDYAYGWLRCDATGGGCATFGETATTHVVVAADMGDTLRFRVTASNPGGTTQATSAQTAVVPGGKTPPPPPPTQSTAGCPAGRLAQASAVTSPARLVVDRESVQPALGRASGEEIVVRYHVSDTCGQSVQGALVYATAVPFGQLSNAAEQPTDAKGYVSLTFRTLAGFPLGKHQRTVAIFVRARKQGEDLLAGISARRLFAIPISG